MPELPEVETIVRDLARFASGAKIEQVEVLRPDLIEGSSAEEFEAGLEGQRIEEISRRAKNILLRLNGRILVINLGMTGRVLCLSEPEPEPEPEPDAKYTGVRFRLSEGRFLVYHDVRRFGRLQLCTSAEWEKREAELGLEPLSDDFSAAALHELTRRSNVAIKTWLMDQRRVVGVGNIYASESLHRAKVDPRRAAKSLDEEETGRIRNAIRSVLDEAIRFRGTTLLDYRDASGERGEFARRLRVYDRKGEPCPTCGTAVQRIVQGGRATFFCPRCQS